MTVILGANDHGKTNILQAIEHLNPDKEFDAARDLSWDRDASSECPVVEFHFDLSAEDRNELETFAREKSQESQLNAEQDSDDESDIDDSDHDDVTDDDSSVPSEVDNDFVAPRRLIARRAGIGSNIVYTDVDSGATLSPALFNEFTPLVEVIQPINSVTDSVTAAEIVKRENGSCAASFGMRASIPTVQQTFLRRQPRHSAHWRTRTRLLTRQSSAVGRRVRI